MIKTSMSGHFLSLALTGRIDSVNAPALQEEILKILEEHPDFDELTLDIEEVRYISSAGLRVLLFIQKKMVGEGKKMNVVNPDQEVLSVFQMTGFSEILNVRQKIKRIDLGGAKKIGEGLSAEVYLIDDETVLKLYKAGFDQSMMYKEKDYAKEAFVLGIPTAISYDMVECEGRTGILFEMIKARDLSSTMRDDIGHLPKYAEMFADLALRVHQTDGSKTNLPRKKEGCRMLLRDATCLSKHEREVMQRMLDGMPEGTSIVHGDFHTGNTMISNGELVFIDMGDLGVAEPYSDLAQVYSIFHLDAPHDVVSAVSKINDEQRHEFYRIFINRYYDNPSPEVLAHHEKMIRKYLAFRILFFVQNFPGGNSDNIPLLQRIIKEFE